MEYVNQMVICWFHVIKIFQCVSEKLRHKETKQQLKTNDSEEQSVTANNPCQPVTTRENNVYQDVVTRNGEKPCISCVYDQDKKMKLKFFR